MSTVRIPLTQGKFALIDEKDVERVLSFSSKWHAVKSRHRWYAEASPYRGGKLTLHQLILNVGPGMEVDHQNGDGLDNRRSNLRPATRSLNGANRGKPSHNTSGFKGVSWDRQYGRWRASINKGGRCYNLGRYDTPEEAAAAYNEAAPRFFGEFAALNDLGTGR